MVQLNITVFDDAHPLTEGIRETFSTNVLPFTGSTWAIVAGLFSLFLIHECYAACFRPILTRPDHTERNRLLQSVILLYWFCAYMNDSLLLPLTLDFAESMGESATMSGFFGSSSILASIAGVMMGRVLVSESQWNQRWARTVVIWSPLLGMAITLMEARVSNAHVLGDDSSKRTAFWTMIMLGQAAAFFQTVPYVPLLVMWSIVTPNREKSFWTMLSQCARQGGLLVGPGVLAIVSKLARSQLSSTRNSTIAPASLMAWALLGQCAIGFCSVMANAMVVPNHLPSVTAEDEEGEETVAELSVDSLNLGEREEVVHSMVWFAFERQLILASIESCSIMILELMYQWPAELTGSRFTLVSCMSLALSAAATVLVSRKVLPESSCLLSCSCVGLLSTVFLFNFGGPGTLMLADGLIVSCAAVSNGIAEGWGSKAAVAGTSFSNEAYRTSSTSLTRAARFLSPMLTRSLVDCGGRNVYASVQMVMAAISTVTVYKSVRMVWRLQRGDGLRKATKDV